MVPVTKKNSRENAIFAEQDRVARQAAKVIPFGPVRTAAAPPPIVFEPAHVPFRVRSRRYTSGWFDLACFVVLLVLLFCALSL